jgi:excisionase family DNA binding protein
MPTPEPQWVSISAAASSRGVHPDTIRRAIARGEIEAERFGPRLIRINPASLDAYARPLTAGVPR